MRFTFLLSLLFLSIVSYAQTNLSFHATYNVQKEFTSQMDEKEIKLVTLDYKGHLYAKNEKFIYWNEALYLDKYLTPEINIELNNTIINFFICLDTIQNIYYLNTDSNIWRGYNMPPVPEPTYIYSKGFWQASQRQWKYLAETRDIDGLHCQHAQLYSGTRLFRDVWFYIDIATEFTPFGKQNLPGLVVEANDLISHTSYRLISFKLNKDVNDKIFWPDEFNHELTNDLTQPSK